jgi:predicted kinase
MQLTMPNLIVLVGIPGVGKSTFIRKFLSDKNVSDWVVISSDDIIERIAKENGQTYDEAFPEAIKISSKQIFVEAEEAFRQGKNVIWDQTNLTAKARTRKVQMFRGYNRVAMIFQIPHDLDFRLLSRPGKTIPKYVLDNMIETYEEPKVDEGFRCVVLSTVDEKMYLR